MSRCRTFFRHFLEKIFHRKIEIYFVHSQIDFFVGQKPIPISIYAFGFPAFDIFLAVFSIASEVRDSNHVAFYLEFDAMDLGNCYEKYAEIKTVIEQAFAERRRNDQFLHDNERASITLSQLISIPFVIPPDLYSRFFHGSQSSAESVFPLPMRPRSVPKTIQNPSGNPKSKTTGSAGVASVFFHVSASAQKKYAPGTRKNASGTYSSIRL